MAALCTALIGQAFASGPRLSSVSLSPGFVLGGATSAGTVTLDSAAPTAGVSVSLASDNAAATTPGSAVVASGATTATFSVATTVVGKTTSARISASLDSRTRHTELKIEALQIASVAISPATVTGGGAATGTVTLNGAAPAGGSTVTLSSSDASTSVPTSVSVSEGTSSATFAIATSAVSSQARVKITATLGNSKESAGLLVEPTASFTVSVNPTTIGSGSSSTGTVTLATAAPSGGLTAKVTTNNSAANVEGQVRIRGGQTTGSFGIMAGSVSTSTLVTLTVAIGGVTQTASITVTPPALKALTLDQTALSSGGSTIGHVRLTGRAPQGGYAIQVSSNSSSVTVPATVTVKQGHDEADFKVVGATVTSSVSAVISATDGTVTETAALTVSPLGLASINVFPTSISGGHTVVGVVALNGLAPSGGVVVGITSSDVSATVPATVTIKEGHKSATFKIATSSVALQTPVTLTATVGTATQTATLIVNPVSLVELDIHPSHVKGGNTSTGLIRLDGPAPAGGLIVTLSSNSASASVPATVTIPAGQNAVAFTITTAAVTAKTIAEISASVGSLSKTQTLTITL